MCVCQGPAYLRVQGYPCDRQESRALSFSEEKAHWQLPMNEVNIICDVATKDGERTHVAVKSVCVRFRVNFQVDMIIAGMSGPDFAVHTK